MRKTLSLLGLVLALSPLATTVASARMIDPLEADTHIAASFDDGTIYDRERSVLPYVSPNGTQYQESAVDTIRRAQYKAHGFHCTVFKDIHGQNTAVCKTPWNGR